VQPPCVLMSRWKSPLIWTWWVQIVCWTCASVWQTLLASFTSARPIVMLIDERLKNRYTCKLHTCDSYTNNIILGHFYTEDFFITEICYSTILLTLYLTQIKKYLHIKWHTLSIDNILLFFIRNRVISIYIRVEKVVSQLSNKLVIVLFSKNNSLSILADVY